MSAGTLLAGVGILIVLVAYVARPFRRTNEDATLDRAIEAWVGQIEAERAFADHSDRVPGDGRAADDQEEDQSVAAGPINFCSQCGRRVVRGDRFCSGCGNRLRRGDG